MQPPLRTLTDIAFPQQLRMNMSINFTFHSFAINNTRAAHEDTDYVAVSLRQNGALLPVQAKKVGDVNNGTHAVNFTIPVSNTFRDTDEFVFSYLVINHGGGKTTDVTNHCVSALTNTALTTFNPADAAIKDLGNGRKLPVCVTAGLRAADDIRTWWDIIKPQFQHVDSNPCDGLVVADRFSFTGQSIDQLVLAHLFSIIYLGMNSAVGCGSNSHYSAQWDVSVGP